MTYRGSLHKHHSLSILRSRRSDSADNWGGVLGEWEMLGFLPSHNISIRLNLVGMLKGGDEAPRKSVAAALSEIGADAAAIPALEDACIQRKG